MFNIKNKILKGNDILIKLLGNKGCSRCAMIKNLLTNKGVDFDYKLLDDIPEVEKQKYLKMASEKGLMSMPIIIKNDDVVDFKEVM